MVQDSSSGPRERRRLVVVGAIVALVAVVGITAWTLAPRPTGATSAPGPRLSIAVVAPVEPSPEPGGILDVGTLNDGFDRAALDRQPGLASDPYSPPDAYAGEDFPPLEPVADIQPMMPRPAPVSVATVTTTDPLADGSRLFGFDRRREPTRVQPAEPQSAAIQSESAKNTETFFE